MTTLIQECDLVENTILFLALTPEQLPALYPF